MNIDLEALFLLLGNATTCIPEAHRNRVFQDMAYKLMEWYDTPRVELRKILEIHGTRMEERCYECNTLIKTEVDQEDAKPLCKMCSKLT